MVETVETLDIKKALKNEIDMRSRLGYTPPYHQMLYDHGTVYQGAPHIGKKAKAKECFRNALMLAITSDDLTYVEGLAQSGSLDFGMLMEHAWCVDKQGKVVDPTWDKPEDSQYIGIPFAAKKAWGICVKKKTYQVFFEGVMLNMKLIEKLYPEYKGREWRKPATLEV